MKHALWKQCLTELERELSEQLFNIWIRPLHPVEENGVLRLLAPNRFVLDWVRKHHLAQIEAVLARLQSDPPLAVVLEIGSGHAVPPAPPPAVTSVTVATANPATEWLKSGHLNPDFTFATFVEGNSNQLARAACLQVAENPGQAYNPLFIYGGTGLGKTHLMHAVGNMLRARGAEERIVYQHSEQFVADMVRALQHNAINDF